MSESFFNALYLALVMFNDEDEEALEDTEDKYNDEEEDS